MFEKSTLYRLELWFEFIFLCIFILSRRLSTSWYTAPDLCTSTIQFCTIRSEMLNYDVLSDIKENSQVAFCPGTVLALTMKVYLFWEKKNHCKIKVMGSFTYWNKNLSSFPLFNYLKSCSKWRVESSLESKLLKELEIALPTTRPNKCVLQLLTSLVATTEERVSQTHWNES